MALTCQNFTLYQNDDKILDITVRDENEALVDISGTSAAQWIVKKFADSTTVDITKTLAASQINVATSGANGVVLVTIASTDTTSLAIGEYYHELRITDAAGKDTTICIGTIDLRPAKAI